MGQDAVQKIGPEDRGSRCLRNVSAIYKTAWRHNS